MEIIDSKSNYYAGCMPKHYKMMSIEVIFKFNKW